MYEFPPGSTGITIYIKMRDSTTGLAKTGLAYNSAGGVCSYTRTRGSATSIPLVTLSGVTAVWTAGGFIEVDPTLAPGLYRLDVPDASLAAGAVNVVFALLFTGTVQESEVVQLETPTQLAGAGAISWTVSVLRSTDSTPLAGASVWVTTDAAGNNVVAGTLSTNTSGQVTFFLNAGTYYLWVKDQGYTGTNPTTFVVS